MCLEKRDRRSGICCGNTIFCLVNHEANATQKSKKAKKKKKKQKEGLGEPLGEIHAPDLFVVIGLGSANSARNAGLRGCRLKMRIRQQGWRRGWEHHDVTPDGALSLCLWANERQGMGKLTSNGTNMQDAGYIGRTETDLGISMQGTIAIGRKLEGPKGRLNTKRRRMTRRVHERRTRNTGVE